MKRLKRYEIIGFIITSIVGTIFHFIYNLSGKIFLIGLIAPINESPWEHMKLMFIPYFVYAIIESFLIKDDYKSIFYSKLVGILVGMVCTLSLFYTITGASGRLIDWFNILTFFIGLAVAYLISYNMIRTYHDTETNNKIALVIMIIMIAIFITLTINPPHIPLFQDPITKTYGI